MTSVVAGPNLTPGVRNFTIDLAYTPEQSEVQDGCITNGTHKVMRFDFISKNIGDADFTAGRPLDSPQLFYYHLSHHHFHMRQFNQYKLIDSTGNLTIPASKPGFCLTDIETVRDNPGETHFSTCNQNDTMGISAGWADVYTSDLPCQYLVIDGVPDGDYIIVVTTNAQHAVPEDTFDDNTFTTGLHIQGGSVAEMAVPTSFTSVAQSASSTFATSSSTGAAVAVSTGLAGSTGAPSSAANSASSVSNVSVVLVLFIMMTLGIMAVL